MLEMSAESHFAHRGLHDQWLPRNSLAAIVAASDAGFGVEFDIQLSQDRVPFVTHDPNTISDTGVDLIIAKTHSSQLRELKFLGTEYHLSTLDDVLSNVSPTTSLLVDIKPTNQIRATVLEVGRRITVRSESVAMQSFEPHTVFYAKRNFPNISVGQLGEEPNKTMRFIEYWQTKTLVSNYINKPDFINMWLPMLNRKVTHYWREKLNCPVLGWTVVDEDDIELCRRLGVGMVFENVRPCSN
jgi:glycerophosphoryl diester phosphodiesterase